MSVEQVYVLRYRCDGTTGFRWTLRGQRADGSFYGEMQLHPSGSAPAVACCVQGQIPSDRLDEFRTHLQVIDCDCGAQLMQPHFAVMFLRKTGATGPEFVRLLNYRRGDELHCARAAAVVQMIKLVQQQLRPFQRQLLNFQRQLLNAVQPDD